MDVYPRYNDSYDHKLLLATLKFTVCLVQDKSSVILNETLSRQYFPLKNEKTEELFNFYGSSLYILTN